MDQNASIERLGKVPPTLIKKTNLLFLNSENPRFIKLNMKVLNLFIFKISN